MTEHIRITPEGEAIIPRDVCEMLDWRPGMQVELEPARGALYVHAKNRRDRLGGTITIDEFIASRPPYKGKPATLKEMDEAIDRAMAERWAAKEARSR